jgi:heme exporter protein B
MSKGPGFSSLGALLVRELRIGRRIGGAASMGVVFFLCLVTITPFAIGPDLKLLARVGPAILWIAALLATLLGLDRLFQADHDDGSLDLFLLGETPLELIVLVKCLAHLRRGGLLLSILVLPICVPVLIFGVAAASAETEGLVPFMTPFLILCGLSLGAIAIAPFAVALALRNAAE